MFLFLFACPVRAAVVEGLSYDLAIWPGQVDGQPIEAIKRVRIPNGALAVGSIASGDLGADGVAELLIGAAPGSEPTVRALRADGSRIFDFSAYDKRMVWGVKVAIGDLDGDGMNDIVTGTGPGVEGHLRIFTERGKAKLLPGGLYPAGRKSKVGINVAVGDVDGDGKADIVTAPASGSDGTVRVWKADGKQLATIKSFDDKNLNGVHVAVGDVDGDGKGDVIAAPAFGLPGKVKIWSGATFKLSGEFEAIGGNYLGGLRLAAADLNNDGKSEIIVTPATGERPRIRIFDGGGRSLNEFVAFDDAKYQGGADVTVGAFGDSFERQIVTLPLYGDAVRKPELKKYIVVSLTEQRLRAFERGRLVKSFLVSTGLEKTATPVGNFSITAKPYKVDYVRYLGPGNPGNYNFPQVPYNLRFAPHFYIHYAHWHNDFGRPKSHGCVNVDLASAKWVYDWAEVGTPITIER